MNLHSRLYESLLVSCDRSIRGCGLVYTVAMLALGLGIALNLLTVINLLWTLHVLHDPYGRSGVHPEHYVYALLYGGLLANTILARVKFNADCRRVAEPPALRTSGSAYVLGSAALFGMTLALGLLTRR